MKYEFTEDGCILVEYGISYINATYEEDRENMIGVCRMTSVEIEYEHELSDEIMYEVKCDILNHFADKEYFMDNFDWKSEAANDISNYTGVAAVNIEFE